jgi:hypothetical protein
MSIFKSLLLKQAYGYDVSGVVQDASQDNVRDKTSPVRNPNKEDFNPQNTTLDGTTDTEELKEIEAARKNLNPHISKLLKKSAISTTALTNLNKPGFFLQVDFANQEAYVCKNGWEDKRDEVPYQDVLRMFEQKQLHGLGHNEYILK